MRILKWIGGALLALLVLVVGALVFTQWQIAQLETSAPEDGAPGAFLTVNGKKLHVLSIGDPKADPTGAPMVLIHGAEPGGMLTWSGWVERFRGKRSVVMIDQIGFGHSERPTTPGPNAVGRRHEPVARPRVQRVRASEKPRRPYSLTVRIRRS